MSGIFGLVSKNDDLSADVYLNQMLNWNKAYGKKHEIYADKESFMGCRLEHLNDDIRQGTPVISKGNNIAVIDALLYNRDEIIKKSSFPKDENISDEELLFDYINVNGYESLENVNGDFSGAIYNKEDCSLTLFRDHLGVRPLFYYCSDNVVLFSTDIRGLIAVPVVDASLNEEWVLSVTQGYFYEGTERTEYKNIYCVEPGSWISFSYNDDGITKNKNKYWEIGRKKIKHLSDAEYQRRLRLLIEDSIKRRMDVISGKIGAELSGGLDSGVIDILINRSGRECKYYSWSNSPSVLEMAENDERLIIKDICEQEGITCSYEDVGTGEDSALANNVADIIGKLDFDEWPNIRYVFPAYINTNPISFTSEYMNSQGVSAVFTGHGGDEGVSHRCNPYEMFHNREFYHYFRYMYSTTNGYQNRISLALKRIKYNLGPVRKAFKTQFVGAIASKDIIDTSFADKFKNIEMPLLYFAYDPIQYIKRGGSRSRLDNIALLGAYSGVRYLVPYLDYRVVDYAVSIPRYQYLRGRKDRYIFREAFKDIMPDSLYRLRVKEDFSRRNLKEDPNWFETFSSNKMYIYHKLDKAMWSDYLDMDKVAKWAERGETKGEEKNNDIFTLRCLMVLLMAQNVIDKTRRQ